MYSAPPLDSSAAEGMRKLCEHILDPVVEKFGHTSMTFGYVEHEEGYRSLHGYTPPRANIGGAADILTHQEPDTRLVLNWIRDNCEYDRLILYPGSRILCVAWTDNPRRHCKEWRYVNGSRKYMNAVRIDLSDTLPRLP